MSKSNEQSLIRQEEDDLTSEMEADYQEIEELKRLEYQQEVIDKMFGRNV